MDQVNCQRHGASQAHLAQEPSPETVRPSFALGTAVNSVVSRIAHKLFQLKKYFSNIIKSQRRFDVSRSTSGSK